MLAEHPEVEKAFGQLPLYFIENQGLLDTDVAYYVQGADKTLYFTERGITFALKGEESRWAVALDFEGAHAVKPVGEDRQEAVFSYFKGKPEDWHAGLPTYARLVYEDLWPGIDLVYSGTVDRLKYEFVVRPGADPGLIRLAYRGASAVKVTERGALRVDTPVGSFEDGTPYAYQTVDGRRNEVSMRYALMDDSATYSFAIGNYDPTEALILDPVLVVYCGYIGGWVQDMGHSIAVDSLGCAYVVGCTNSSESEGFPVQVGPIQTFGGFFDTFVAKVNAEGTDLVYCGYIGGSELDWGNDIAVDDTGCAYIVGETYSDETSLPVMVGPDLTFNGETDVFVAKVNASGTWLDYCGYIGGAKVDCGYGIAVDGTSRAHVTGYTQSAEQEGFPVLVGPDLTFNGGSRDVFIARINAGGAGLDFCGYIGGSSTDVAEEIAVDSAGSAYVSGMTNSDESSFPVKTGPDLTINNLFPYSDAFVAKVNTQGTGLDYCGYIGGEDSENGCGIAVDDTGCAYIAGWTRSSETEQFPVLAGPGLVHSGYLDAFIAKVNAQGSALVYCGYLGGSGDDHCWGVAVDHAGCAYLAGYTESTESSFPVLLGPDLTYNGGDWDAYIAKVNEQGTGFHFCGYLGGSSGDLCHAIALDESGCAYMTGTTESSEDQGFPVVIGPDLTYNDMHGATEDAYMAKISMALVADSHTLSASTGGTVDFGLYAGLENAQRNYLVLGSISGTTPGTPLPGGYVTLPLNWDVFTDIVFAYVNWPYFSKFFMSLNKHGQGSAMLCAPSLPPSAVGIKMHYAFCLNNFFDFASNPVGIEIIP
jgi:hypothetical protein